MPSDVSEFDTLKELKADLKKKITGERKESAQRAFEDVLMQKVAEGITCDIPDAMVDLQAEQMANNFKQQLASQGIPFDQYLKMTGTTEADFLFRPTAPLRSRSAWIWPWRPSSRPRVWRPPTTR